jgi:hypothetical protein
VQQLRAENKQLKREVQELREKLTAEAQIKHLVELLGQNSHNSSWPSSRDKGRQKPKPKSLRHKQSAKLVDRKDMKGIRLSSIQSQISLNRIVQPSVNIARLHCPKKL